MRLSAHQLAAELRSAFSHLRTSENAIGIGLSILIGVCAGFGAVAFWKALNGFHTLFFTDGGRALGFLGSYYVIILPAIGGLIVGLIIHFWAKDAKGEGVPEAMEVVAGPRAYIRHRTAAIRALASSICIGSGGSVGPEGPIVHIGSSIGSAIGKRFKFPEEWTRVLILCGAAGGLSATFNAPIGGMFFALEVISRRIMTRGFLLVAFSSVVADLVAHQFLGTRPIFMVSGPGYALVSNWELLLYAVLGIVVTFASLAFVRLFYGCEDAFSKLRFPVYLKPLLGGIAIGLMGFYYPYLFGVGYNGIGAALLGNIALGTLVVLVMLKMFATSITLGSGGSGGLLAPSLFIGAMLGGVFGILFHNAFPAITAAPGTGTYVMVGMGTFFAVTLRAPLTSFLLVFEMTHNYAIIPPMLIAIGLSTIISRSLFRESIYTMKLVRKGVDIHRRREVDVMRGILVSEVMTKDFPTVPPEMPIQELIRKLMETGHHGFPVVDGQGRLCGTATLADVEAATSKGEGGLTVGDIATKNIIVAYPDQSLHDALAQFGGRDVGRIPVVDRNDRTKLLGVLRRHDIMRAYTKAMAEREQPP